MFAAAAAATMVAASSASAQVNFYTQGWFTSAFPGCGSVAPVPPPPGAPVNASCAGGGFTLNYTAVNPNPGTIASGSIVQLGTFSLTGTGNATVPPNTVMFTLAVQQTAPTPGNGTFMGYITGTVATDGPGGDFSSLVWRPQQFVNISPATYQLLFDNAGVSVGGIGIPVNQSRAITGIVTVSTVPEPSTYLLMSAGLAGLFFASKRRRRAA